MELPDPMSMGFEELVEYTKTLQKALVPFSHASRRIKHYGGLADDSPLYAESGNTLYELLVYDEDLISPDECTEECRTVNVGDLDNTTMALYRTEC